MKEHPLIGRHKVGPGQPTFVTAELGINHNGKLEIALELIHAAAKAGCQAVKFQTRTVTTVYSPEELAKPRTLKPGEDAIIRQAIKQGRIPVAFLDQGTLLPDHEPYTAVPTAWQKFALELAGEDYHAIDRLCRELGILWYTSCWDVEAVDFIARRFSPPCWKIAAASLTDLELLRKVRQAAQGTVVFLSTGMSSLSEIERAVETLGTKNLVLMHCRSTYPAAHEELNLTAIRTLEEAFGVPVGYSGHELGLATTTAAVAIGACAIERHLTLSRSMPGSDQVASIEPGEFASLVSDIRNLEKALGDGFVRCYPSEEPVRAKLRRVK